LLVLLTFEFFDATPAVITSVFIARQRTRTAVATSRVSSLSTTGLSARGCFFFGQSTECHMSSVIVHFDFHGYRWRGNVVLSAAAAAPIAT
jgi:hypothetical protein